MRGKKEWERQQLMGKILNENEKIESNEIREEKFTSRESRCKSKDRPETRRNLAKKVPAGQRG
jgi:hypothetical protein